MKGRYEYLELRLMHRPDTFPERVYLTLTYSYFEKYYWLPPLILNGKKAKNYLGPGDKLFFFTNIKTDGFETYDKVLLK